MAFLCVKTQQPDNNLSISVVLGCSLKRFTVNNVEKQNINVHSLFINIDNGEKKKTC